MEYSRFLAILMSHKKIHNTMSDLLDIGFDFFEGKHAITHPLEMLLENAILTCYTEKGLEWVTWFMYESEYGQRDWSQTKSFQRQEDGTLKELEPSVYGAFDEDYNPICYSYESLWEYIEKYHRK